MAFEGRNERLLVGLKLVCGPPRLSDLFLGAKVHVKFNDNNLVYVYYIFPIFVIFCNIILPLLFQKKV